ncbi:alpha/beta hydrolase [Lutimonas sp.]|uniref:alpha/beta hydrolase n=1 Tax=Lutimonas sp. TaxID=1872403 RepID=UPI003D9BC476
MLASIPENTPAGSQIFISGDFEGWSGGQEGYELAFSEGQYSIILPDSLNNISFKFTRGSWDQVEVGYNARQTQNRSLDLSKNKRQYNVSIENWKDLSLSQSTASKNVHLLSEAFEMPQLNSTRQIWIYLPPDYEKSSEHYPVLYLQDGQNLFNAETSYNGEWEVDEVLDVLFEKAGLKIIAIGIENAGAERINEYTPWKLKGYGSNPKGDAYIRFITETLKPYVDENYRSLTSSENTGIIGSSLGGLISHYAAFKYPEIFGLAGVFSPSFELTPESFNFTQKYSPLFYSKIYYMSGDSESPKMDELMLKMTAQIKASGFPEANIKSKVVAGGEHNETLWRENFGAAVSWLFDKNNKE